MTISGSDDEAMMIMRTVVAEDGVRDHPLPGGGGRGAHLPHLLRRARGQAQPLEVKFRRMLKDFVS